MARTNGDGAQRMILIDRAFEEGRFAYFRLWKKASDK
jgi:hypothetical protein